MTRRTISRDKPGTDGIFCSGGKSLARAGYAPKIIDVDM
jgi:hypothetical protein